MADIQAAAETVGPYGIAGAIALAAVRLGPHIRTVCSLLYAIWEQREIESEQRSRRDRRRRRAESTQPPMRGKPADSIPEFVREESTDVIDIRADVRKRAPRGFRPPTRGEHHDGEG